MDRLGARTAKWFVSAIIFLSIITGFSPGGGDRPGTILAEDTLVTGQLKVKGVELLASPITQTVPVNVATTVSTTFSIGQEQVPSGMVVKAELRGPGLASALTLSTLPNHPFSIPGFPVKGTYFLDNIRLEKDGKILLKSNPEKVTLEILDVVITEIKTRPLTLDEIREKGIVINNENFKVWNISIGFALGSEQVRLDLPVIYTRQGVRPVNSAPVGNFGLGLEMGPSERVPLNIFVMDLELPEISLPDMDETGPSLPSFSGVLIFNNQVAVLNQFFSIMLIVSNNAPQGSSLTLKDLSATITYLDDGLREAKTNPPHIPGTPIPVHCPGPDGKLGTSDDLDIILAAFQGMSEFLAEGLKEGVHSVQVDFSGTLSGLPSGDTPIKGKARGSVLVRYPELSIAFAHPGVVRSGEEYDVFVTVTNTSKVPANLFSLTLPSTRQIGTKLLGAERVEFESILSGESRTAKFHMKSLSTGEVRASAFRAEGNVTGSFVLTVGVGEKGIPLSPDTIVLPAYAYLLPADIIESASMILGETYSVATTPAGSLPEGIPYLKKDVVTTRAYELAEAGQRVKYGDSLTGSLQVLLLDWLGNKKSDLSFDILRRLTSKGRDFAARLAAAFDESPGGQGLFAFQRGFGETTGYKNPYFAAALENNAKAALAVQDYLGKRIARSGTAWVRDIPFGEALDLHPASGQVSEWIVIGTMDDTGYTAELQGKEQGTTDLSLLVPDASGGLREVRFSGVECRPGSLARVTVKKSDTSFQLQNDLTGGQTQTVSGQVTPITPPPFRLIGAVQECLADSSGHAVALLFNRELDDSSWRLLENFTITGNRVFATFMQSCRRVVMVGCESAISPFVESRIQVGNIADKNSRPLSPSPTEMAVQATISDPGGLVSGLVSDAAGNPMHGVEVVLYELDDSGVSVPSRVKTDENGRYQFSFVRMLSSPFKITVIEPVTRKMEVAWGKIRVHGQHLNIDIVFRGRGSLHGRVLTSAGIPVEGAVVIANPQNGKDEGQFSTRTDATGTYSLNTLPVGRVFLCARTQNAVGYAEAAIVENVLDTAADIVVNPFQVGQIKGFVLQSDGTTPVAAAPVMLSLSFTLGNEPYQFSFYSETDAEGAFFFGNVPAGQIQVIATNPRTAREGGRISGTLAANQTFTGSIIFRGTGSISGQVLEYDGNPKSGVIVYLVSTPYNTTTDSSGEFVFPDVPVGNYTVCAVHRETRREARTTADVYTEGAAIRVALSLPSSEATAAISGHVFNAGGSPVSSAQVLLFSRNCKFVAKTQTGSDGYFQFDGLLPDYYELISVMGKDGGCSGTTVQFAGHHVTCNVTFRGLGKIRLQVKNPEGNAGLKSNLIFGFQMIKVKEYSECGIGWQDMGTATDANGHVEWSDVPIGQFAFEVSNPFYSRHIYYRGQLSSEGQVLDLELRFPANTNGTVQGHVLMPDGQTQAANARVVLHSYGLPDMETRTDNSGFFLFNLVPSGNVSLEVVDEVNNYREKVSGALSGGTFTLDLKLRGRGEITGTVKTAQGAPVPGARVLVWVWGFGQEEQQKRTTDSQGQFHLTNILEGDFTLQAKLEVLNGSVSGKLMGNGALVEKDIVIEAAGMVAGTVVAPDGVTPAAQCQVVLFHSRYGATPLGYQVTPAEGQFLFEYVPAGSFRLEVFDPASGRRGVGSGKIMYEGETVSLNIKLEGWGTVSGTFTDASGTQALAGATVKLRSSGIVPFDTVTTTGASGEFRFEQVGQGSFNLSAVTPGSTLIGYGSGKIDSDGQTLFFDIRAEGSGTVHGIVTRADGVPAASARVRLHSLRPSPDAQMVTPVNDFETVSDANGLYNFNFIPLYTFDLKTWAQSGRGQGQAAGFLSYNGQSVERSLVFQGWGTVSGLVKDEAGNPQENVSVKLRSGSDLLTTVTGSGAAAGTYSFSSVYVGPFTVEAQKTGGFGASAGGEITSHGQAVNVDLVLASWGEVKGKVLLSDGTTPAEYAAVVLKRSGDSPLYAGTDAAGNFSFATVKMGAFSIDITGFNETGYARTAGQLQTHLQVLDLGTLVLDNIRPTVVSVTPTPGAVNVPLGTNTFTLVFSEPMTAATVNNQNLTLRGGSYGILYTTVTLGGDNKTATMVTTYPLESLRTYTINVSGNVEDAAGNKIGTAYSSTFTAIDTVPPVVQEVSPVNNGVHVSLDSRINVRFSEPVDPSSIGTANLVLKADGQAVAGSVLLAENQMSAQFVPAYLQENKKYTVEVKNLRDLIGNLQTVNFSSTFYTDDTIAPVLTIKGPATGLTVREGSSVQVTCDLHGAADIGRVQFLVNDKLSKLMDTAPYTFVFNAPRISDSGTSFTVKGIALDVTGNASNPSQLSFTLTPDAAPQVTISGPADGFILPGQNVTISVSSLDDVLPKTIQMQAKGGTLNWLSSVMGNFYGFNPLKQNFVVTIPADLAPGTLVSAQAWGYDYLDQRGTSPVLILRVPSDAAPPHVQISQPAPDSRFNYNEVVSILANAVDDVRVKEVRFFVNGQLIATDTDAPYAAAWTAPVCTEDTRATIRAEAYDLAGNQAAAEIQIIVNKLVDSLAPKVKVKSPAAGTLVYAGEQVQIETEASDDQGLSRTELYADGQLLVTKTASPWNITQTYTVPADAAAGRLVPVLAKAVDVSGKETQAVIQLEVVSGYVLPNGAVITETDTTYDNGTIIIKSGTVSINGTHSFANVLVKGGGKITHGAATTSAVKKMHLVVTGKVCISDTSSIDTTAKGYLGGFCADNSSIFGRTLGNVSGSGNTNGGSFGGYGGQYYAGTYALSEIYGSLSEPQDPGSGGGGGDNTSWKGGSGGGMVRIQAGQVLVDGKIAANGEYALYGSGAGGSVWIQAGILSGKGMIEANGGDANLSAGGGGRAAVYYQDASAFNLDNVTAYGGKLSFNYYPRNASAGTVYLKPDVGEAMLVINNRGVPCLKNRFTQQILPGTVTSASGNTLTDTGASFVPDSLKGMKLVPDLSNPGQTFAITGNTAQTITVDGVLPSGLAGKTYAGIWVFPGRLIIRNTFVSMNRDFEIGQLSLLENSSVSHGAATTTSTAESCLYIKAVGRIEIDSTSKIDASSRGYVGGYNGGNTTEPGRTKGNVSGSTNNSGGSHGGYGGKLGSGIVSEVYGSIYQPKDLGAGGGGATNQKGGYGGGAVRLEADELQLDGNVLANGGGYVSGVEDNYGGGAGGSVWVQVRKLSGTGKIEANGGKAFNTGGGGGRAAVYYTDASGFNLGNIFAYGGNMNSGYAVTNGGAGSVFLKPAGGPGELSYYNRGVTSSIGTKLISPVPGTITSISVHVLEDANAQFIPGSLTGMTLFPRRGGSRSYLITGNTATRIFVDGDMTGSAQAGDSYGFSYYVNFTFRDTNVSSGDFNTSGLVLNNAAMTISGSLEVANDLVLQSNSTLTHDATTASSEKSLFVEAKNVQIDATSRIDLSGKGFLGGYQAGNAQLTGRTLGNVPGSGANSGGSHGGYGGVQTTIGESYGSISRPAAPGSGGGAYSSSYPGGSGGGVLRLICDTLTLQGSIKAKGSDSTIGGGAGGSLWIQAGVISGTGSIEADGGNETDGSNGAAGGGGRIALYYMTNSGFDLTHAHAWGGKYYIGAGGGNTNPGKNGMPGTVYLSQTGVEPDLILDNGTTSIDSRSGLPCLRQGTVTSVSANTLTDSSASFLPGSLTGLELVPDVTHPDASFTILSNTTTTITTDPSDGDLFSATSAGKTYSAFSDVDARLVIRNLRLVISDRLRADHISILQNGILAHPAATIQKTEQLYLQVRGKLVIDSTSKIDLIGLGYLGARKGTNASDYGMTAGNTTTGGSYLYSGGSHGGLGGRYQTYALASAYGSVYQPVHPGSGGGGSSSYPGGTGGGVLLLEADEMEVSGSIKANGGDCSSSSGYGAGAGGSLWIKTRVLSGSGTIQANGGTTNYYLAGGGGGGRAALYYTDAAGFDLAKVTAYGGSGGASCTIPYGGAGTVYLKPDGAAGQVVVNNLNHSSLGLSLILPAAGTITALSSNSMTDASAQFTPGTLVGMKLKPKKTQTRAFTVVSHTATVIQTDPADGDMTEVAQVGDFYELSFPTNMALTDSTMFITGYGHFPSLSLNNSCLTVDGDLRVDDELTLQGGSILTHSAAAATTQPALYIQARWITVDSTSKIDVTGKGFLGGRRNDNTSDSGRTLGNALGSSSYNGGSYGGFGGRNTDGSGTLNDMYGSFVQPASLGSGGGGASGSAGGSGGGSVHIEADQLTLDGSILANGENKQAAAGSGGSAWIKVSTLRGTGQVAANGADSSNAAGGGGRVAVYYEDASQFDLAKLTAFGGKNSSNTIYRNASAGTVYIKPDAGEGNLVIDNNATVTNPQRIFAQILPRTVTSASGSTLTDTGASYVPGFLVGMKLVPDLSLPQQSFLITANTATTITVEGVLPEGLAGKTYAGTWYMPGKLTIRRARTLINRDLEANQVSILDGAVVTHNSPTITSTAESYLFLKASGRIEIDASSKIDLTGKGYLGGYRTGNSSSQGRTLNNALGSASYNGGSHGGLAGVYSGQVNADYGSLYQPADLGSGGGGVSGSGGGNGGGALRLEADELALNGSILASSEADIYKNSGGSGGSVWINVNTLSGSGTISASGADQYSYGAGGGGRVALYYNNASGFNLANVLAKGGKSGSGGTASRNGAAGTVFLKPASQTAGDLVIDNGGTTSSAHSTVLPAVGTGFNTLLEPFRLTCSSASFVANALVGIRLNPNAPNASGPVFTIVSNTGTVLQTLASDGDMTQNAQTGYPYIGEHRFFNLKVSGSGHLKTLDRINASGTITVDPGATIKADNMER